MNAGNGEFFRLVLCILGMAVVTALPRVLPITLLSGRTLPPFLLRWLSFVPVAVLAALLAPEILLRDGRLYIAADNFFLLATVPTLLVAWRTGSFFGAVAAGMGAVALLRLL